MVGAAREPPWSLAYSAWVSAATTVTIRACNLDPANYQKNGASGTILVDLWKHQCKVPMSYLPQNRLHTVREPGEVTAMRKEETSSELVRSKPVLCAFAASDPEPDPMCCGKAMQPRLTQRRDGEGELSFVAVWRCLACGRAAT